MDPKNNRTKITGINQYFLLFNKNLNNSTMKNIFNISKIVIYNIIVLITILILFETILFSIRVFVYEKPSIGYFYKVNYFEVDGCQEMISHPFYGYVHNNNSNCNIREGFSKGPFVYYNGFNPDNRSILVLGGSTTDGYFQHVSDGYTWPYFLQKLINEKKINYNVINGGTGGYNSDQELLKLIIDAKNINSKIDYVISLNGINDIENYKHLNKKLTNKIHYFDKKLIDMFNEKIYIDQKLSKFRFLPNIIHTISYYKNKRIDLNSDFLISSFDEEYISTPASESWLFNVNAMNLVTKVIDANYKVFLQPTMGINGQIPTNEKTLDYKIYNEQMTDEYYKEINDHYDKLKKYCGQLNFATSSEVTLKHCPCHGCR